jgi:class 3 adenylate cyclase
MKVGFGSAGVEIIRKNLEKKQGGKVNLLTSKGLSVSCIFLFCDIRQFTDATECLQEEVFVFTNRIAAVVHSFCHSYGGSANKNVGDAFLCSWLLDDPPSDGGSGGGDKDKLYAKNNQADKCLLCVVKVLMALHHDNYYIETMSEAARHRLLTKLKKRPGPVVQMGCGLHAGSAVQGAIGSERKIDATYVSEAVEMSEFLESSTKKYGLKMLMSNSFHSLLHANNRQRCRLVDQIVLPNDDDEDEDGPTIADIVELYTYGKSMPALACYY